MVRGRRPRPRRSSWPARDRDREIDLHIVGGVAAEKQLRLLEGHVDEGLVVFAHADGEDPADDVGLARRRRPHDRGRAIGRDQGDRIADPNPEQVSQLLAHQYFVAAAVPAAKAGQRTVFQVAGDDRQARQIGWVDAAHDRAGGRGGSLRQGLELDHRNGQDDARHSAQTLHHLRALARRHAGRDDESVAIEALDLGAEFAAEAVHDRHGDDQGGDGQGDGGE